MDIVFEVTPPPDEKRKAEVAKIDTHFLTPPKRKKRSVSQHSQITPLTPEEKTLELFRLAKNGQVDELRDLIAWGVDDINAISALGNTALMWAARNGRVNVIDLLIKSNANIFLTNQKGYTALHCAVLKNQDQAAFKLLENIPSKQRAILKEDIFFREIFIKFKRNKIIATCFKVNAQNTKGETMFMLAARYGHVNTSKLLIAAGADVNMQNSHGKTAHMQAEEYKTTFRDRCPQMVEDLRQRHTLIFSFVKAQNHVPPIINEEVNEEITEGVKNLKIDKKTTP